MTVDTIINWWDLVPAAIGAIVGAFAGGVPAYLIAKRQSNETLKRDAEERLRHDKINANRVFSKLLQMSNELLDLRRMIEDMLERPVDPEDRFPNQRRVSVIVGTEITPVEFDAAELQIFVSERHVELINEIDLLRRRRNALFVQLNEFRERKIAHSQLIATSQELVVDDSGSTVARVTKADHARMQFEEAQIEALITPLIAMVREESKNCVIVSEAFNRAVSEIFDQGVQAIATEEAREYLKTIGEELPDLSDSAEKP
ncbi:MAG: hypothetical protein ACTS1Z_04450 [Parasphingopyxis sp.]